MGKFNVLKMVKVAGVTKVVLEVGLALVTVFIDWHDPKGLIHTIAGKQLKLKS